MINELILIGFMAIVTDIRDGNTIEVQSLSNTSKFTNVILNRIAVPDKNTSMGKQSSKHLREMILGATVEVKIVRGKKHVAEVYSEGESVSNQMVLDGFATKGEGVKDPELQMLQRHALQAEHGLWEPEIKEVE